LGDYLEFLKSRPDQFEVVPVPGAAADVFMVMNVAGNATVVAPSWGHWRKVKEEQRRAAKKESDWGPRRQGPYSTSGSKPWGCKVESQEDAPGVATVREQNQSWGRANKWQRGRPVWLDEISKPLPPMKPVRIVSPTVIEPPRAAVAVSLSPPDMTSGTGSEAMEEELPLPYAEGAGQSDGESDGADLPFVIDATGDLHPTASSPAPEAGAEAAPEEADRTDMDEEDKDGADDDDDLPFVVDVEGSSSMTAADEAEGGRKKPELNVWSLIADAPAEP